MQRYTDFSDGFYRAAMAHILLAPLPPLPKNLWDETGYAISRMRMLARKQGDMLDDSIKEALFLALRSNAKCASPRAKGVRRALAAKAALGLGRNVPLQARQSYLADCGNAAGCIARLLYTDEE